MNPHNNLLQLKKIVLPQLN